MITSTGPINNVKLQDKKVKSSLKDVFARGGLRTAVFCTPLFGFFFKICSRHSFTSGKNGPK